MTSSEIDFQNQIELDCIAFQMEKWNFSKVLNLFMFKKWLLPEKWFLKSEISEKWETRKVNFKWNANQDCNKLTKSDRSRSDISKRDISKSDWKYHQVSLKKWCPGKWSKKSDFEDFLKKMLRIWSSECIKKWRFIKSDVWKSDRKSSFYNKDRKSKGVSSENNIFSN